jgi:hypothetical protein
MSGMRTLRVGLIVLSLMESVLGGWQLFWPREFFDDFPLPSHPWVAMMPPYNLHLMIDSGALNLAFGVMLGIAAVSLQLTLVRTVLTGLLIFAVVHTVFHETHLETFPMPDAVAQTVALVLSTLVVAGLLIRAFLPVRGQGRSPADRELSRTTVPS